MKKKNSREISWKLKNVKKKKKWAGFWLNYDQLLFLGSDLIIWFWISFEKRVTGLKNSGVYKVNVC